jgi:hypothetical protein
MKKIITLVVFLHLVACDVNIGGAGYDNQSVKQELDRYPGFISPLINESLQENCGEKPTQQFEKIFDEFPKSISSLEGSPKKLTENLTAEFSNQIFTLKNQELKIIVQESLPSAFYMHPMRVGLAALAGHTIIIIVDQSRATTGRFFVAIYLESGQLIYRKILKASEVWDIVIENGNLLIKGSCSTNVIKWVNT